MQRSNLDSILITSMLALFLFSGFKLFIEEQNPFLVRGSDFLAEIDSLSNTVKKKSGTLLAWNDAKTSQKLFDGDQLYTHENSEVDILFRDSTKINILENSLFKLERKKEEALIVLKEGIFYIRTKGDSRKIKVKVANRELSIDSLESKLQVQGQGIDSKIIVLEGQARIGISGQEVSLKPNQFIELKETQEQLEVKQLPIKLLEPAHNQTLFNQEQITFSWEQGEAKSSLFQVSRDPNFKDLYFERTLEDESFNLKTLPKGVYYWRVLKDKENLNFEIRKIVIFEPIQIIGPLYSSLIRMKKPDSPVYFNWKAKLSENFQIEVSSDSDFNKILVSKEVKGHKFEWDQARPGQYFWRLKKTKGEDQIFTNPFPFQIRRESPLAPPSIKKIKKKYKLELKKKKAAYDFSLLDLFINKAKADEFEKQTILEWPKNKDAKAYRIEVYSDKKLKKLLLKEETSKNSFIWKNPPIGKFYWRLALIDYWEQSSGFSEVIEAEVIGRPLPPKAPVKLVKKPVKKIPTKAENKRALVKEAYYSRVKRLRKSYFRFIQSPSIVKYNSTKGRATITSSGSSLASFEVETRLKRDDLGFYEFSLKRLTGEAFTNLAYSNLKLDGSYSKYFHLGQEFPLYYNLGARATSSTYYTRTGVDQLIENKNTSFSLIAALGASRNGFFNLRENYKLQAGLGTNLSLEALFDLQYLYTSKFSLGLGTSASYEKFKTEEEVSVSFFKLNLRFSAFYYF